MADKLEAHDEPSSPIAVAEMTNLSPRVAGNVVSEGESIDLVPEYYIMPLTPGQQYNAVMSDDNSPSHHPESKGTLYTPQLHHRSLHDGGVVGECIVCFDQSAVGASRQCCSKHVCTACLTEIIRLKVTEGIVKIDCPNPECDRILTDNEIVTLIKRDVDLKNKYDRFRLDYTKDGNKKTCPRCCLITEYKLPKKWRLKEHDVKVKCTSCDLDWCFKCHAPWHEGLSCKAFQTGEKEFEGYTKERQSDHMTPNCQRCPMCRVFIERTTGCPHMTCNRCGTGFCYFCGDPFIPLLSEIFHESAYSFLGCNYNFKGGTLKRLAARGTYGTAIIAFLTGYPILFAGGVALIAVCTLIGLPFYIAYKVYRIHRRYRGGHAV